MMKLLSASLLLIVLVCPPAHGGDKPGWGPLSFGDGAAQVLAVFPQCTRESERMLKVAHYDYRTGKADDNSLWRLFFNFDGPALREIGLMLFGPPVHMEVDAEKEARSLHVALIDRYGPPGIELKNDDPSDVVWKSEWDTDRSHILFQFTRVGSRIVNGARVQSDTHRDEIKVTFTAPVAKGL